MNITERNQVKITKHNQKTDRETVTNKNQQNNKLSRKATKIRELSHKALTRANSDECVI